MVIEILCIGNNVGIFVFLELFFRCRGGEVGMNSVGRIEWVVDLWVVFII